MTQLTIQKISTIDDVQNFRSLFLEALEEDISLGNLLLYPDEYRPGENQADLEKGIFRNHLIASIDGKIIGFVRIGPRFGRLRRVGHNFEIGPIFIKKDQRGHGFGKKLIEIAIQETIKNTSFSYLNIFLQVNALNINAIQLYQECGFLIVGKEQNFIQIDNKYIDVVSMQKIIQCSTNQNK